MKIRIQKNIMISISLVVVFSMLLSVGVLAFAKPDAQRIRWDVKLDKSHGYVQDEIVVKFKSGIGQPEIDALSESWGIVPMGVSAAKGKLKTRRFQTRGKLVKGLLDKLQDSPAVMYAELNYIAHALFVPNDTYYDEYQWNLKNLALEQAWDISTGQGVVVAVVDTGVAYTNYGWSYKQAPDLAGTSFVPGRDFVNNDAYPLDDNGHGTHIAGTIAGTTNNGQGVAGVAFGASIMPVKVLDSSGAGTYADIADGIIWAADHGAQVINLSLGGPYYSSLLRDAVAYAYSKGAMVVAAAGNSSLGEVYYPAAYDDYVLAIGAVDARNNKAPYSNWGSSLDIVAPGGDLRRDDNQDGYGDGILQQTLAKNWWGRVDTGDFNYYFYQGTSQAAAHVSGVVALLVANGFNDPTATRQALKETAIDRGEVGWDLKYGWGLINPLLALETKASAPTDPGDNLEEDNSQIVIEEPEEEQEEVVEYLKLEVATTDRSGDVKKVFNRRERVYLKVLVESSGGGVVEDAGIDLTVHYPNSSWPRNFSGETDEHGEWSKGFRAYQRGSYDVGIVVEKDGYEKVGWEGSFIVR